MADRPILFSAPMVLALLAGRKTQTRRTIFDADCDSDGMEPPYFVPEWNLWVWCDHFDGSVHRATNYQTGDRLWVRESYFQRGDWIEDQASVTKVRGVPKWCFRPINDEIIFTEPEEYRTSWQQGPGEAIYKRLGRFMPRRYSRLTLTVTDVRVQRLQDCSLADAYAEGVERREDGTWKGYTDREWTPLSAREAYMGLWDSINTDPGKRWADNPWVVAISFDVEQRNIDA